MKIRCLLYFIFLSLAALPVEAREIKIPSPQESEGPITLQGQKDLESIFSPGGLAHDPNQNHWGKLAVLPPAYMVQIAVNDDNTLTVTMPEAKTYTIQGTEQPLLDALFDIISSKQGAIPAIVKSSKNPKGTPFLITHVDPDLKTFTVNLISSQDALNLLNKNRMENDEEGYGDPIYLFYNFNFAIKESQDKYSISILEITII